jgi:hypothetical protein
VKERIRYLFVGLYAWIAAVYLGGVLLDRTYANHLKGVLGAPEAASLFSQISDTMLYIGSVVFIAAIVAIAISWNSRAARYLFIASLLALSFEFIIPFFATLFGDIQGIAWIRPFPSGIASVLAFIGVHKYYRP